MKAIVSTINSSAFDLDLKPMRTARALFITAWQEGDFKFLSYLQENLQRHVRLLDQAHQQVSFIAQGKIASLSTSGLNRVIEQLERKPIPSAFSYARKRQRDAVSSLQKQIDLLRDERNALDTLPALNSALEKQRLLEEKDRVESLRAGATEDVARYSAELERVEKAIAALEQSGLQTRFGNVVPSLDALSALMVPGGEYAAAAKIATDALKDLQTLLGDVLVGMQYGQLHEHAKAMRRRAQTEQEQVRRFDRRSNELTGQLDKMDTLHTLEQMREQWGAGAEHLLTGLQRLNQDISRLALDDVEAVKALAAAFRQLLAVQQRLVAELQL
ncbi:alpha-xenorhabdolysin family binary toxin subunit B [Pseudomonas cremoricolorata]|uniref:alpha-xenorhabdolysin family binary toxin subunit B n=1 Tax=Pseudomonas cremoricolorata TaxID=157783 RepID=UPI00041F1335|nr:alpha-xenorhabdolysin family binary toxin subunit B [Pseudomonas cremoricolorata]